MPSTSDQAVCIRHWDWSETSQTVSLLTRSAGIVRGIAKGAKRERAPFSGGIELLTRGEVVAIIKPHAELATITAWDLQETFPAIRRSLSSFHCAMYMADVTQSAIHDHDPHPAVFDSLVSGLRSLGTDDRAVVLGFLWVTLGETGWRPQLERDVVTGETLAPADSYGFAPSLGGFTSERALPTHNSSPGPLWRTKAQTVAHLRTLQWTGPNGTAKETTDRACRLLNAYLSFVLGRELRAAAALFSSRSPD